ncbi:alpha-L-fucosidase [Schaalia sp. lx-260]|uniref:alpha-L-fucosidase n=1 Tax=Schaalia sp. lx-260 TaxID=2899082 RepID=UPI001E3CBC7C|nr:alpha-L-fucosidase [Schaalia sp. lx-260]MCD4548936.1 alpha-L-fucosidase [Schaalia sp. lx-260]
MRRTRIIGLFAATALVVTGIFAQPVSAIADEPETPSTTPAGVSAVVPYSTDQRIAQWQSLQFGFFMHWGVYSMYEGKYKEKVQRIGYPEQIKAWENIPREEYLETASRMTAEKWDAAHVCATAKAAGMKYVMITTKHHDGFAMWDTKTTDYDVVDQTAFGQDPIRQLADECAKVDMKLAFYYSIIDWEKHEPEPYSNVNPITDEHLQYNLRQIEELMTNYGPIAEFWFDMGKPTPAQSQQMADKVRSLQPNTTVVNSRVWNDKGDFEVGGDNSVPTEFRMGPWESILSIFPACWSYCSTYKANRAEANVVPKTKEAINGLVTVISGGGQYAFNIGPRGDGSFDPFDQKILDNLAAWRTRHPNAIEGAHATWFPIPNWGRITAKDSSLYLFPRSWSDGSEVSLSGIANKVQSVTIDGTDTQLPFTQDGTTLRVTLQGDNPDEFVPVIKVQLDGAPMMVPENTVYLNNGEGTAGTQNVVDLRSAKGHALTSAYDVYVADQSGKTFRNVDFEFSVQGRGLGVSDQYILTFGDQSMTVTGEELSSGIVGGSFTLEPRQVKRLRIRPANPAYYANPIPFTIRSVTITARENEQIGVAPTFKMQPEETVSVRVGQTATFSAVATGRPSPTYQWYRVDTDGQVTAIEDEIYNSYSFEPTLEDNGTKFRVVAKNTVGEVTSHDALLNVLPPSLNLALEKPARQITTGWGGLAERAVDGNTDGVWNNGSLSHTSGRDEDPWWEVDLEDMYKVTHVDVFNRAQEFTCQSRTIPCSDRLKDFYVVASPEPLNDLLSAEETLALPNVKAIKVDGVGGYPSTVDFGGFEARYIRVILPGREALALAEVEVYGKATQEAPEIAPIQVTSDTDEGFSSDGDGQSRTVTARVGTRVTATTQVIGTPEPTLQWQRLDAGSEEWTAIEGAQDLTYTFTITEADEGAFIRLVAENSVDTVESQLVELHATVTPTISAINVKKAGEDTLLALSDKEGRKEVVTHRGTNLTLGVQATGTPAVTYQWQKAQLDAQGHVGEWAPIEGAVSPTYSLTADEDTQGYVLRVVVSNAAGEAVSDVLRVALESQTPPPASDTDPAVPMPGAGTDPVPSPGSGTIVPPSGPRVVLGNVEGNAVARQGEVTFTASGFAAGEDVTFTVHSTPIVLGTVPADSSGVAIYTWRVPADFELGTHHVISEGASGLRTQASFEVIPTADQEGKGTLHEQEIISPKPQNKGGGLAHTGVESLSLVTLSGLAAFSLGFVCVSRRRRDLL